MTQSKAKNVDSYIAAAPRSSATDLATAASDHACQPQSRDWPSVYGRGAVGRRMAYHKHHLFTRRYTRRSGLSAISMTAELNALISSARPGTARPQQPASPGQAWWVAATERSRTTSRATPTVPM